MTITLAEAATRLREKGESRGAKPFWWGSGGIPQLLFLPPSWLGRGQGDGRKCISAPC